jgi:hypothetical protein
VDTQAMAEIPWSFTLARLIVWIGVGCLGLMCTAFAVDVWRRERRFYARQRVIEQLEREEDEEAWQARQARKAREEGLVADALRRVPWWRRR